jgi:hypothetical protein
VTTPNAELAYKVLDHIDAHPETWHRASGLRRLSAEPVACFAGWTCLLSGEKLVREPLGVMLHDERDARSRPRRGSSSKSPRPLGLLRRSGSWTRKTSSTANTREDLGRIVEEIFGPRPGGAA